MSVAAEQAPTADTVRQANTILIVRLEQIGRQMEACADHMVQRKGKPAPSGPKCEVSKIAAYMVTVKETVAALVEYRPRITIFQKADENEPLPLEIGECYLMVSYIDPSKPRISNAAFKLSYEAAQSVFNTKCPN